MVQSAVCRLMVVCFMASSLMMLVGSVAWAESQGASDGWIHAIMRELPPTPESLFTTHRWFGALILLVALTVQFIRTNKLIHGYPIIMAIMITTPAVIYVWWTGNPIQFDLFGLVSVHLFPGGVLAFKEMLKVAMWGVALGYLAYFSEEVANKPKSPENNSN